MRILAISDEECVSFWDYYTPEKLAGYDLIISCGDLKASYLSFLVTMTGKPLLYVHGNHDTPYIQNPPEGCDCIDDQFVIYNGLRILGLGGCKSNRSGNFQYTERQMRRRILKMKFLLWKYDGVDIVVTHSPPKNLGDIPDSTLHQGFESLIELIDRYNPQYLLHGHVHMRYMAGKERVVEYNDTKIINVSERYSFEIEDKPVNSNKKNKLIYKTKISKSQKQDTLFMYIK